MHFQRTDGRCIVTLTANAAGRPDRLDRILEQFIPTDLSVRLDLAAITLLNSADLAQLVELHKEIARQGKELALVNLAPLVRKTLVITRLDQMLTVLE